MPRRSTRQRAEIAALFVVCLVGISAAVADLFGWLDLLQPDALPKITLLVLSTVTLFLLLEVDRFHSLDSINQRLGEILDQHEHDYAGLVDVRPRLVDDMFIARVDAASRITVLNTWIPNLEILSDALRGAASRGVTVRILLLRPDSEAAQLRDRALREGGVDSPQYNVAEDVRRCLHILAIDRQRLDEDRRDCLQVRLYNSLPSISVYGADERYLVSVFFHGQLAIHSPQLDIKGSSSVLGKQVQRELDTLWAIGRDVDWSEVNHG